jgi:hypothetical protein
MLLAVLFSSDGSTAWAQQTAVDQAEVRDNVGIVWFIGEVEHRSDGQATVNLGDAHALRDNQENSVVAVFRAQDLYFRPLGIARIEESYGTWSIVKKSVFLDLQTGDRVIYARTLSQLGTGDSFRDDFIRRQITKTGTRNSYGTISLQSEARTLQKFISVQPKWVQKHQHVAGIIRAASLSRQDVQEMEPLLTQVMKFQDYQALGISPQKTIGMEWQLVLDLLAPPPTDIFGVERETVVLTAKDVDGSSADAENTDAAEASTAPDAANAPNEQRIESIRKNVERLMFARSKEERNVVVILCVTLEKLEPKNERQWFSLQLRSTQFAPLADDRQFLDDIQNVMRLVRQDD